MVFLTNPPSPALMVIVYRPAGVLAGTVTLNVVPDAYSAEDKEVFAKIN